MINIVGIGPGNTGFLTDNSKKIIEKSSVIIGGSRQIEAISFEIDIEGKDKHIFKSDLGKLKKYIQDNMTRDICILASGDPSIYSIGNYVIKNFADVTKINVNPGISSIQLMFAKIGQTMNDLYISSSHGREPDFDFIFMHNKIALLTDNKIGPKEIAGQLRARNLKYKMYIGYNLSYEDEKILSGNPDDFLDIAEDKLAVVVLIGESDEK